MYWEVFEPSSLTSSRRSSCHWSKCVPDRKRVQGSLMSSWRRCAGSCLVRAIRNEWLLVGKVVLLQLVRGTGRPKAVPSVSQTALSAGAINIALHLLQGRTPVGVQNALGQAKRHSPDGGVDAPQIIHSGLPRARGYDSVVSYLLDQRSQRSVPLANGALIAISQDLRDQGRHGPTPDTQRSSAALHSRARWTDRLAQQVS